MIRCPTCESILDEMGFPKVQCPHCGTIIETRTEQKADPVATGQPSAVPGQQGGQPTSFQYPNQPPGYPQPGAFPQQPGQPPYGAGGYPQNQGMYPVPPGGYPQQPPGVGPHYPMQMPPGQPGAYPYGGPPPIMRRRLDISDTLNEAYKLYKDHFFSFFELWAVPGILGLILILILSITGRIPSDDSLPAIFYGAALFFLIVMWPFAGGIISMTREVMDTGKTSASTGYKTITKRGLSILIAGIVFTGLVVGGWMVLILPGILFCYWYFFTVTFVTLEGLTLWESMKRSKKFSSDFKTFFFLLSLSIALIVISFLALLVVLVIFGNLPGGETISIIILGLVFWAISPYVFVTNAYYYLKANRTPPVHPSQGMFAPWPGPAPGQPQYSPSPGGYQSSSTSSSEPSSARNDGTDDPSADDSDTMADQEHDTHSDRSDRWDEDSGDDTEDEEEIPTAEAEWISDDDEDNSY